MLTINISPLFFTVKGTEEQIRSILKMGIDLVQVKGKWTVMGDAEKLYNCLCKMSFEFDIEIV